MSWKTGNNIEKGYKFSYNRQDMLTDADYEEGEFLSDNIGHYDESLSYDKMGNILSLIRYGLRDDNKYGLHMTTLAMATTVINLPRLMIR